MSHTRQAAAAVALLALLLAGCTARDRAGGQADEEVVTLTFAQAGNDVPEQLRAFADEIDNVSDGTLQIKFENAWRMGEADFETGTIQDVQAGKVDMAWVGARAFDQVGLTAFQPLLAPLLIDSHELQSAVFEEGIPDEMMAALKQLDVVGVGVLPGPLRKLLSKGDPLTAPESLHGLGVGIQASDVAERTFASLGAASVELPSSAEIGEVDAYEQQVASIWGNHYEEDGATSVVGNLNLWPRPLVIFVGHDAYSALTDDQRAVLHGAAGMAVAPSLEASRAEDQEPVESLCLAGIEFPEASASELAAWRDAVAPVYDAISSGAQNKAWLARIEQLKAHTGAEPDAASCIEEVHPTDEAVPHRDASQSTSIEGTYRAAHAAPTHCPDFERAPGEDDRLHEMVFEDGRMTGYFYAQYDGLDPIGQRAFDVRSDYDVFRDTLTLTHDSEAITMTWKLDGDQLVISDVQSGCIDAWILSSKPWTKVNP